MNNDTETIEKYVRNLPKGMKEYLVKDAWPGKLLLIKQARKMTEEQAVALKTEVFLIIIGIENYSDLKANIQKNVAGVNYEELLNIVGDVERDILSEIKPLLTEMENANNAAEEAEKGSEEDLSKDSLLSAIENPIPTKSIVQNPAGKNPILDAQHNLPVGEPKKLISSAAVPSRGPMLSNFKNNFGPAPTMPVAPIAPATPIKPVVPLATPVVPTIPVVPKPLAPQPVPQPQQPTQPQKPPPAPMPSAPDKYTIDPYRELPE